MIYFYDVTKFPSYYSRVTLRTWKICLYDTFLEGLFLWCVVSRPYTRLADVTPVLYFWWPDRSGCSTDLNRLSRFSGSRSPHTLPLHVTSASSLTAFKQLFKLHLIWFSFPGLSPLWLLSGPCSVCCHLGHYKNLIDWLIDWLEVPRRCRRLVVAVLFSEVTEYTLVESKPTKPIHLSWILSIKLVTKYQSLCPKQQAFSSKLHWTALAIS